MKTVKFLFNGGILIMGVVVIALILGFGILMTVPYENHSFDGITRVLDIIIYWGTFVGKYMIIASFIYLMFHVIQEYDKEVAELKEAQQKKFDFENQKTEKDGVLNHIPSSKFL